MKSRRSFNFFAPYNEEGERVISVPFPFPVARTVENDEIVHDVNPAMVTVAPAAAADISVDTKVQPGALLIVRNLGTAAATVGGAECEEDKVTTLLYDGNGYAVIGTTDVA
jgi:hypothetical protein